MGKLEHVNLLWTGGWDSTFRLLDLIVIKKIKVKPYYIYDEDRLSTEYELKAMDSIRKMVNSKFPYTTKLFKETEVVKKSSIPKFQTNKEMYSSLRKRHRFGEQYIFLADFAEAYDLKDLELSIHRDDKAFSIIKDHIESVKINNVEAYQLKKHIDEKDYNLFKSFRYPIPHLTKIDMGKIAKEHNFDDIIEETWFCHTPHKGKACGKCGPCRFTFEENLGRRLPVASRIKVMVRIATPTNIKKTKKLIKNKLTKLIS